MVEKYNVEKENVAKFRSKKVGSKIPNLDNVKGLYEVRPNDPIGVPLPVDKNKIPDLIVDNPVSDPPEPKIIDQPIRPLQGNKVADQLSEISGKLTDIGLSIADSRVKKNLPYISGVKSIPISTPAQPPNPFVTTDGTIPGYSVENISKEISSLPEVKTAPKVYVTCYGPGSLNVIYSSDGRNYSNKETFIPEGSNQVFYTVYDLRLRSATEGCEYQLSENEIPLQRLSIIAAEKVEQYNSISTRDFNGSIAFGAIQTANIGGLIGNRYFIRSVNIQSIQPLDFNLLFFSSSTFDTPGDLDTDTFLDSVELDMSQFPSFRINFANQFRLSVTSLEIVYEDTDNTNTLHVALENLSPITKLAGPAGAVQIDFKMSPRI